MTNSEITAKIRDLNDLRTDLSKTIVAALEVGCPRVVDKLMETTTQVSQSIDDLILRYVP